MTRSILASIVAAVIPLAPALAAEPRDSGWPAIASAREGDCALTVTGNGQFYRVAASGLGAGEPGRFRLVNGDMRPLDWRVQASPSGEFARYYLPFRWHRSGGDVTVSVESARCTVATSFAWRRADVGVR